MTSDTATTGTRLPPAAATGGLVVSVAGAAVVALSGIASATVIALALAILPGTFWIALARGHASEADDARPGLRRAAQGLGVAAGLTAVVTALAGAPAMMILLVGLLAWSAGTCQLRALSPTD